MTKFNIQIKTKSRTLIQNIIHSIEFKYSIEFHSLKKMSTKLFKISIAIPKANNCLLYETYISTFAKQISIYLGTWVPVGALLGSYLSHSINHVQALIVPLKTNKLLKKIFFFFKRPHRPGLGGGRQASNHCLSNI